MKDPKSLLVKTSTIPMAGKGLFTKKFIAKGTNIVEYKGKISSWKDANHKDGENLYIFYVNRNHVIDADGFTCMARYANDARGLSKIKGTINNSKYVTEGPQVFIRASRDIEPGSEILVGYGKDYWDVIRKM